MIRLISATQFLIASILACCFILLILVIVAEANSVKIMSNQPPIIVAAPLVVMIAKHLNKNRCPLTTLKIKLLNLKK